MYLTIEKQNFILSRNGLTEKNITHATPTMFMARIQNPFTENRFTFWWGKGHKSF